jgi:hypothetical protein
MAAAAKKPGPKPTPRGDGLKTEKSHRIAALAPPATSKTTSALGGSVKRQSAKLQQSHQTVQPSKGAASNQLPKAVGVLVQARNEEDGKTELSNRRSDGRSSTPGSEPEDVEEAEEEEADTFNTDGAKDREQTLLRAQQMLSAMDALLRRSEAKTAEFDAIEQELHSLAHAGA